MKTDSSNQLYHENLAKYLSGEMNETEEKTFLELLSVLDKDSINLEMMKQQWSDIAKLKTEKSPDTMNAWNKLHSRIEEDGLIPDARLSSKNSFLPSLLKVAAIVIVFVAVGILIYLNSGSKTSVEMVQLDTSNENSTLIKTLNDGSVIYLAQNSRFSFPAQFEEELRKVELKGEAFFDIASNPDKPFIIETKEATIEVLGTAFNVKTQNGEGFELNVDRGKVKVTLKNDPSSSQLVIAGEKVAAIKNNLVKSSQPVSDKWYRQRMHFKDESLQNIISVLNRNFNTTFVISEKETGNRKLTVTFSNETAETMTELICLTLNLKSQTINGSVVLSEKTDKSNPQ